MSRTEKDAAVSVLVVEDNAAACEVIEEVLAELSYNMAGCAKNGQEALEMAVRLRPDVILMDIGLPDLDGIEVTRRIQQESPTPVVVISAFDRTDLVESASVAGAGAYVVKPPTAPELERAVTIALARFHDMMELDRLNRKLQAELAERRRAEEELRRERDFIESLIDTAHTIVLVLDTQGRVVRFNRYMEEISGWPLKDAREKSWFDTFLPPDEREDVRLLFNRAIAGGPVEGLVINRIVDREGNEHLIEWYNKKLYDANGALFGILATGQDVTDREAAEAEKKELESQLQQAQKIESIGRLAGGIAHDFNNLLTPMIGYADMALMDLDPADPLYGDFEEIREVAERAKNLTGQLLAFSRRQVLEMKVVNLNDIVSAFQKMLRRIIGEDIEFTMQLEPELKNAKADPAQIQQVIMNLAINARDAMPEGGRLTIQTQNAVFDEACAKGRPGLTPGNYVMLAVSDTGIGMAKETAEKIFEPFFTTKAPGKGTGLGLATVYGIVKQHDGHIWVNSELGKGTSFKIYLPQAAEEAPAKEEPPKEDREDVQGSATILVVEDEDAVRKLTCNILKSRGCKVLEAQTSQEALRIVETYEAQIDLLLTDVVMPQMNGRELYRQAALARPGLKVLYMSGYTDEVIAHHGVLDAQIEFLQKPFTIDELVKKVSEMLVAPPAEI